MQRVAALATSFNRRELTLSSLASLFRQRGIDSLQFDVYLVNDGSSDGTEEAVHSMFPSVKVLQGDGTLFWNGGMRLAFEVAMRAQYDAYLWFNDDILLNETAVQRVLNCATERVAIGRPAIVCGSLREPGTLTRSFGGYRVRTRGITMKLEAVEPHDSEAILCDTMNGNFTLIPAAIAASIGNLDGAFRHQLGDFDYGLRARRAGFDVMVAPGYVGECAKNDIRTTWRDRKSSFAARWRRLMSPKGTPPKEWILFTRRHYEWRWLFYALSPYLRVIFGR